MFSTGWLRVLLVPFVALLAASGSTGASASSPLAASGTFTYTSSSFNSVRSAGGNTIIALSATVAYAGTFSGTSTVEGTLIFHADGSANFHDVETFTGSVNGVPGTVTFHLAGTGSTAPPQGSFRGTDAIISATGDLANLHGVLSEVGTVPAALPGPEGTYTGQLQSGNP
jgi:hypothetical protein